MRRTRWRQLRVAGAAARAPPAGRVTEPHGSRVLRPLRLLEFAVYVLAGTRAGIGGAARPPASGATARRVYCSSAPAALASRRSCCNCVAGLDLLAEAACWCVRPACARAVCRPFCIGVATRCGFSSAPTRAVGRSATLIRRRSGVAKLEIDLRGRRPLGTAPGRLARTPLRIGAVVYVSHVRPAARCAAGAARRLDRGRAPRGQPALCRHAAGLARVPLTGRGAAGVRAAARGTRPRAAAAALAALLGPPPPARQRRRITMRK